MGNKGFITYFYYILRADLKENDPECIFVEIHTKNNTGHTFIDSSVPLRNIY